MNHRYKQQAMRGRAWIAVLGGALVACGGGGGGGGGGPPPVAAIEVPTAARVEAASAGSDITLENYRNLAPLLAQVVLTGLGSGFIGAAVGDSMSPTAVRGPVTRALSARSAGLAAAQDVQTGTAPCPISGQVVVTLTDANSNGKVDGGDGLTEAFQACVMDAMLTIDGSAALRFNRLELDANEDPTAADFDGTMVNLTEGTLATLNGRVHVLEKECLATTGLCGHRRTSFDDATATHGGQTVVLRLDVVSQHGTGATSTISGALGIGGQFYALQPVPSQPFAVATPGTPPTAGRLRLVDASGNALEIAAHGTLVDMAFYPRGSSSAAGTWLDQPWSNFQ